MPKLKIIRVTTVPQSLEKLCEGVLSELSHDYEVVALSSPGEALKNVSTREGVRTIAVAMERHISLKKDLRSLFNLIRVFHNEKPYMVHSMTPKAGLLCMIAAWFTRVPVRLHTFTGLVFPTATGMVRRVLILADRMTCVCATHVVPEGEGVRNDLINYHITKKPLKVLGYGNVRGVDLEYYKRTREVRNRAAEIRIKKDDLFIFIFVGRIVRDKGINELTEAFQQLNVQYSKTRLILVGPFEGSLDPIAQNILQIINNNSAIKAVGKQADVRPWFAAADCLVLPSYREGFPNVVLEAGALGLPAIVTDINGSREIITEGENGVIIPSHDVKALYLAMERMLLDKSATERMASKARKMVAERFEKSFVHRCLFDYYKEIIT